MTAPAARDSRGLTFGADDGLAWTGRHALRTALDGPVAAGTTPQRRCGWCGADDMTAVLEVARWDTAASGPLTRCKRTGECVERWLAQEAARREQEAATAPPVPAEATAVPPAKPAAKRTRAPRARKPAAVKAATDSAAGAADPAPAPAADPGQQEASREDGSSTGEED